MGRTSNRCCVFRAEDLHIHYGRNGSCIVGESVNMNKRNAVKFMDTIVGEIWIDKNTKAHEFYISKEREKLSELIQTEYNKCYGNLVPVIE
jgi:hypothetical protein